MEIDLPHNWAPRPYQCGFWDAFEQGKKRASLAWARRSGKDEVALHWTACAAFTRVGTYWHMLPEAAQARKAIWDAVNPHTGKKRIDEAFPHAIRKTTRSQDMFIEFVNGSTWQVVGSDNYDSLVGTPPVGLVFSEYALANPAAWDMLRPILRENGGWAIFISTPRGKNHFHRMHQFALSDPDTWFAETLTVDDTKVLGADEIQQERRELTALRGAEEAESIVQQEYYCSFDAALPGSYYGTLMNRAVAEGRVGLFPHDPKFGVTTSWDLGIRDSTAIWFVQCIEGRVRIIDYLEGSGVGLDWYAKQLAARPYRYDEHIGPHDAANADLGTGKTRVETLAGMGIKMRVLPRAPIDDGIQAVRRLLPKCDFNSVPLSIKDESPEIALDRLNRGRDALMNYHRKWNEDSRRFDDRPFHDWASNGADSFRYLAMGLVVPMAKPKDAVEWPVYPKDEAPEKSEPILSASIDDDLHWAIVVGRIFRPSDEHCRMAKLQGPRDSLLLMGSAYGQGMDSLLAKALEMAENHDMLPDPKAYTQDYVGRAWLPDGKGLQPLRRHLQRKGVIVHQHRQSDPAVVVSVGRQIAKERVAWRPERRWATRMIEALERWPQHTDALGGVVLADLLVYLRHHGSLVAESEDDPVVVRVKKREGAFYA